MKNRSFSSLYILPVIIAFLFELIYREVTIDRVYNCLENIGFCITILWIVQSFRNKTTKKILYFLGYSILCLSIWFESVFYYLYGIHMNPSTIYILNETNSNETAEFIATYLDKTILGFSLLMLTSVLVILVMTRKKYINLNSFSSMTPPIKLVSIISILVLFLGVLKLTGVIIHHTPYLFIKTNIHYYNEVKKFDLLQTSHTSHAFTQVTKDTIQANETYVFIIGESTTKNKMSIYGYSKNTNPRLHEIKDELFLFDQVISPHTTTVASLSKVLTLATHQHPSIPNNGNIIQLMNAAGFSTYWLSNQKPIGLYESLSTKISKAAHQRTFINIANHDEQTPYDHQLLVPLQTALQDPAPKKAIFIHLLGTHIQYDKRYPKEFEYFTTTTPTTQKEQLINHYDNAIRYNDAVVRDIIEEVRAQNMVSFVLYFSDHGEEVYDDVPNFYGHQEENATKSMYEIPFILWTSPQYNQLKKPAFTTHAPFMTDQLIHAVADISGIQFKEFDKRKSIFDTAYIAKPRMIQKNKSYEELFLQN